HGRLRSSCRLSPGPFQALRPSQAVTRIQCEQPSATQGVLFVKSERPEQGCLGGNETETSKPADQLLGAPAHHSTADAAPALTGTRSSPPRCRGSRRPRTSS